MLIDGVPVTVPDTQIRSARHQLQLSADFHLIGATQWLQYDAGNGTVKIPLPRNMFVVAFEGNGSRKEYGVVKMEFSHPT